MLALLHLQAVSGKSTTAGYGIRVAALAHRPEDVPEFAGHFRSLLILQTTALGSRMGIPARKSHKLALDRVQGWSLSLSGRVRMNGTTTASLRRIPEL